MNKKYDMYQDKDGNVYNLTTEVEQLMTEALIELQDKIDKAIDYIENNDLYTQDIDYDYDDNMYLLPPTDELEKKELLEILEGDDNE